MGRDCMRSILSEAEIEKKLIEQLVEGESQWKPREDLRDEDSLWANFKDILIRNNTAKLADHPLTDLEFEQIKNQLNFSSFYNAAVWLRGENGVARVYVQREDASLGTQSFEVFRREDIAGGTSVYEVINQYKVDRLDPLERDRRFDVTLLINGLPMIHIELKNRSQGYMAAFEQIKKYESEGKFRGIYSILQMFVVSNGVDTKYIASADAQHLNKEFLTSWVDSKNNRVDDYIDFAQAVLSIPQAHKMVTEFSVLDSERKSIILLRPYQIHAIQAVERAVGKQQSGYVWHTTGSGKTLTSYKVARNLLRKSSRLDKTIFLVDRKDLDQQTSSSFLSYSEHDLISMDSTENVSDLVTKLKSNDRSLVVTTIQKLNYVMKRYQNKEDNRTAKKLRELNIGFVVDECHRAVSPEKQHEIKQFFPKSLWYGFTGTPIFAENARSEQGDLARTTEEQYGPRLHEYTVKEAIHDKAVLGFQVEYMNTLDEDSVSDYLDEQDIDEGSLNELQKEKYIPKEVYEDDEHKLQVIDKIINHSRNKFGLNKGPGKTYSAILTTKSIPDAQRYYELFQEVIRGESSVKISERVKRNVSDFPKVTVTYSLQETEETTTERQEQFKQVIADYNKTFNTTYDLGQVQAYNENVNSRLARKKSFFATRSEQLDIVIVVDRLLTGFDSPATAILFIDRPSMTPQGLIQAFSRTNRIYDRDKRFGQVMIFEYPNRYKQAVENAFILYSNGGENVIQAPSYEESFERFVEAHEKLVSASANPLDISVNDDTETLKLFAAAFQAFDKAYSAISVYSEYDEEEFNKQFHISPELIEEYRGKYENVIDELKSRIDDPEIDEKGIDFDYQLSEVGKQQIDYEYLVLLMQSVLKEPSAKQSGKRLQDIETYLSQFKEINPKLGAIIDEVWRELLHAQEDVSEVDVSHRVNERRDQEKLRIEKNLANKFYLNLKDLRYLIEHYNPEKTGKNQIGENDLKATMDRDRFIEDHKDEGYNRLNVWKRVRTGYETIIEEEILPLDRIN